MWIARKEQKISKRIKRKSQQIKKYYGYDDRDYKGIRDMENLFVKVAEEGYYKTVKTKSAFNGNYI